MVSLAAIGGVWHGGRRRAGLLVGVATSGALDAAYDRLPDGTQKAIEDGFSAIGDAAGAVGDGMGRRGGYGRRHREKIWNSVF